MLSVLLLPLAFLGYGVAIHPHFSLVFKIFLFFTGAAIALFLHTIKNSRLTREDLLRLQLFKLPPSIAILSIVALGLFTELTLLRYHSSTFQVMGFFKNLTLLACFLGLGMGYAEGGKNLKHLNLFLPCLCLQFIVLQVLKYSPLQLELTNPIIENQTMGLKSAEIFSALILTYGFLTTLFLSTAYACIALGQLAALSMKRAPNIEAYGWNLLGSAAGVLAFTVLSILFLPPVVWLLVSVLATLYLLNHPQIIRMGLIFLGLAVVSLTYPFSPNQIDLYSPYQSLTYTQVPGEAPLILVNHFGFQRMYDFRPEKMTPDPKILDEKRFYDTAYELSPKPANVLIIGSGTGNDVAAALRHEAGYTDAVEIDPLILRLGIKFHPEQPYQDPRVHYYNDDARSFIKRTNKQYDVILFGLLDSHANLSGLSNVRLDSFIYTLEAIEEAKALLTSKGILVLNFYTTSAAQSKKFLKMLEKAFDGHYPRIFQNPHFRRLSFVSGPGLEQLKIPAEILAREISPSQIEIFPDVDVSTDDWPFPYMLRKSYPYSYLFLNGLLGILGLAFIRAILPSFKTTSLLKNFIPFLFGMGFMLVETKAITELARLFGSTWLVTTIVIVAVLMMAFLANLAAKKRNIPYVLGFVFILLSLLLGYFFNGSMLHHVSLNWGRVLVILLLTFPIFFSGLIFSQVIKKSKMLNEVMAANLFGALLGGLLEYNSMLFGFKSLYLMAIGIYGLAFLMMPLGKRHIA